MFFAVPQQFQLLSNPTLVLDPTNPPLPPTTPLLIPNPTHHTPKPFFVHNGSWPLFPILGPLETMEGDLLFRESDVVLRKAFFFRMLFIHFFFFYNQDPRFDQISRSPHFSHPQPPRKSQSTKSSNSHKEPRKVSRPPLGPFWRFSKNGCWVWEDKKRRDWGMVFFG